jgi:outer membrane receptor protein involved in Fe transport
MFIAPYSLLDATATMPFWAKRITLSTGAKNILNIQNVAAAQAGGAHSAGATALPMGMGRTYFVRLQLSF